MTQTNYIPPRLFYFLTIYAEKHKLSIKEVEIVLLRRQAELLGFTCNHRRIGHAKSDTKPYCKECWTRMEMVQEPIVQGKRTIREGKYRPLKTFLDFEELRNQSRTKELGISQ